MENLRLLGAALLLLLVSLGGCTSPDSNLFTADRALAATTDEPELPWDPHPVDPQRCNPQEPLSLPPRDGHCDVEVVLTSTTFVTGQGVSEGKGELSAHFSADDGSASSEADSGTSDYTPGQTSSQDLDLGTYRVPVGDTLDVEICGDFTEHDSGGSNGGDDLASDCTTIRLSCHPVTGQPTFTASLGPETLCGDNVCNGSVSAQITVMRADADMDNVPNADDFTPEPCDEAQKGKEGIALLLYFHYDDNDLITLGQSLFTSLAKVFGAYDYVVLVMDNETSNPGNTSGAAFKRADIVFPPTREGLLDAMQHLTARGLRFDVDVHAHGYERGSDDSSFEVLTGENITGEWLVEATHPDAIGTARGGVPIVSFWATACIASRQIDAWREIGAVAAMGALHINFRPNSWGPYTDAWVSGTSTFLASVTNSYTGLVIAESEALIATQGLIGYGCAADETVLGNNACADAFFLAPDPKYNLEDVYDDTQSGAANMAIASTPILLGNTLIRFGGGANRVWP